MISYSLPPTTYHLTSHVVIILGIESSCDETAAAVIKAERGSFEILSNVVSSQVKVHAKYGGVVPEVAARLHIQKILPIVELALGNAKCALKQIDAIAVCAGPGLMSSLLVGVETAKSLSYALKIPLVKVNHLEGHLLSCLANSLLPTTYNLQPTFPAVGLVVSGGHTQIYLVKDYLKYKLIGETLDDAAGEAFDKVAKIMNLGYPGGPAVSAWAERSQKSKGKSQKSESQKLGSKKSKLKNAESLTPISSPKDESVLWRTNFKFPVSLPRPMINSGDFTMSFSGLKTSVLYSWQKMSVGLSGQALDDLKAVFAAEFQQAVVDVLVAKTLGASEKFNAETVILGGGVSANKSLRGALQRSVEGAGMKFLCPEMKMTGDNAAMIAIAGYYHARKKEFVDCKSLRADCNWELR